jgi:uncharacterized membrane protein
VDAHRSLASPLRYQPTKAIGNIDYRRSRAGWLRDEQEHADRHHHCCGGYIAIRALSPAVNDTFTALTCIDWLSDSLCKIAVEWHPQSCHRDSRGNIRLITVPVSYERLVQRSFEKIRQAADGMPAVLIRQLDALSKVMAIAPPDRAQILLDQAAMIARVGERTVPEPADLADITARHQAFLAHRTQDTQARPNGSTA